MNANKQDAGGEVTNPDNVVGLDDVLTKWRAWLPLIGPDVARRVLETCIMDVGKLCRADPAGMVLVPREIVANYRESTHIPRHRRICDSALAAPAELRGSNTRFTVEIKPDSAPAGSGEVEALASRLVSMSNGLHSAHLCTDLRRAAALLRKLQQGAE